MTHRQMTRRHLLQATGATAGATALAAPMAHPAAAQEEQTITAIMSVGGSGKAFQGGIELFNEQFAGQYRVEPEMVAYETLLEKEISQFISGNATYDVLSINSDWLGGVAHFLEPLDSYIERDGLDFAATFGPLVENAVSYEGQVVGLPIRFGANILFYRQDFLAEAGLKTPRTLEDYRAAAQALTMRDADGDIVRYGASIKAQSPNWTLGSFGIPFLGLGGRLLTADGNEPHPSLTDGLGQEVLDHIKAIIDDGSTPDPTAWTYDDNIVAFQQGRLAMSDEYSARALLVEDPGESEAAGKMGYEMWIMEPLGPEPPIHYASTWQFVIDKNSPNKEAAWELLKFMVSYDAQKLMALEWSNGPTILPLYDDPEYAESDAAVQGVKAVLEGPGWQPYFPGAEQNAELTLAAHEELQTFYVGRQSSAEAVENMAKRFEEILGS